MVAHITKWLIKFAHMFRGGVLGFMFAHTDQRKFRLQRRCANQAGKLRLGLNFLGHQVQKPNFQWPNILAFCRAAPHDHHPLIPKDGECR